MKPSQKAWNFYKKKLSCHILDLQASMRSKGHNYSRVAGYPDEIGNMGSSWKQFKLLLWKNFVLQKRHPIGTAVQILLPGIFSLLLVSIRYAVKVEHHNNSTQFQPYPLEMCSFPRLSLNASVDDLSMNGSESLNTAWLTNFLNVFEQHQKSAVPLVFSPDVPIIRRVMAELNKTMEGKLIAKGFESEKDLENFITLDHKSENYVGGLVFDGVKDNALPQNIVVKIRLKGESDSKKNASSAFGLDTVWYTNSLYPDFEELGPRSMDSLGGTPGYCKRGFLRLQHSVTSAIVSVLTNGQASTTEIYMQMMPYPPYVKDDFIIVLQNWIPMILMLSYLYPVITMTKNMVLEKERKLKESMKIMGLSGWLHWAAWFTTSFILFTLSAFVITALLFIHMGRDYGVINYSDSGVVFVFFTFYGIASIAFSFLLSAMFSKANSAAAFTTLLWFVCTIPYFSISPRYSSVSYMTKIFSCFISNSAMGFGGMIIGKWEGTGHGLTWDVLHSPTSPDDSFSMLNVLLMLFADTVLYLLIAYYLDSVFPGDYGLPKPWYFPFMKRYWFPGRYPDQIPLILPNTRQESHPEFFEADPSLEAGVQIRGLTKVFERKIAVNNLSLNMYKDQITVLLGHNGAGKTTTMSLLTGLFPPTQGTALVNGFDVRNNILGARQSLGLCPQHDVLFDELTVEEHLYFFCKLKDCDPSIVKNEVDKMLRAVDLEFKRHNLSKELSGGMKRRLSVGIALVGGSKVVMLDEPTSGMDPVARRFTWDLLQGESQGRSILLTTHFMDEADILGDRIAIMAHGELQCVGSPLFLKKLYGAGYHMIIVKDPHCDVNAVNSVVKSYLPSAKLESNIGAELSFILPQEDSERFANLFSHFETNKENLGISSFGASVTTMEEVFLRVGEESDNSMKEILQRGGRVSEDNVQEPFEDKQNTKFSVIKESELMDVIGVNRNKGTALHYQQFYAMFVKKAIHSRRNFMLLIAQLIVPISFMILTLSVVKTLPTADVPPSLTLNLKGYLGTDILYANSTEDTYDLASFYGKQFTNPADKSIYISNASKAEGDLKPFLEAAGREDLSTYNRKYIIGAAFMTAEKIGNLAHAWFNGQPYHGAAQSLAAVDNALVMRYSGGAHNLTTVNHPLPRSMESQAATGGAFSLIGFQIAFDMVFGFSILVSSFVVFLVKERSTNAKHLQFVSGVRSVTFWASTFMWDFVNYMIPCILILVLFQIYQIDGYTSVLMQGRMLIVFICFGWSMLPLVYLFSFLYKIPSTAFTQLLVFNIIAGMTTMLIYQILNIPLLNLKYIADYLDWFFLVLPIYCFGKSFAELHNNYFGLKTCTPELISMCSKVPQFPCCKGTCLLCFDYEENYFSWNKPGIGKPCAYMCGAGAVFFLLLLVIETSGSQQFLNLLNRGKRKLMFWRYKVNGFKQSSKFEDEDVTKERERILNTKLSNLFMTDSVILRDLSKHYGSLLAVDHLSLGVPRGECFGLLGVNGAGKTTTFKMLTGDETISEGDAYLEGFSSSYQILNVQKRIGYCPQFDALIEQMTGRETLTMFARLRGVPEIHIGTVVTTLSNKLLFMEHIDKQVKDYSGGNKRKLSTAVALVGDPPVVFLDEPTTGMDPLARRVVWDTVSRVRDSGRSIIYTSHSMEECDVLCTRIAIMVNGQFRCLGSPQHLKSKFGQGYTLIAKIRAAVNDLNQYEIPEDRVGRLQEFIETSFPGSSLKDVHQGMLHYHITNPALAWSYIFKTLEDAKNQFYLEDYSVGQTTLEQVFLSFTKNQRD